MTHEYGSSSLEVRRPPLLVSVVQVLSGATAILLVSGGLNRAYGIGMKVYDYIQQATRGGDLADIVGISGVMYLISILVYALVVALVAFTLTLKGLSWAVTGLREIVTPWMPANLPKPFRSYPEVIGGFKKHALPIYEAMSPFVSALFGKNTMFLSPVRREIVVKNAGRLRRRLTQAIVAIIAIVAISTFSSWVTGQFIGGRLRGIDQQLIPLIVDTIGLKHLRTPFIILVVLQIVLGLIEVVTTFMMVPRRQPSTQALETASHYRGFGHPAQIFSRIPDLAYPLQWDDYPNRAETSWKEKPLASVDDVGQFGGYLLIEQQPRPHDPSAGSAGYLLLLAGWLLTLAGYYICLFSLLPAQFRDPSIGAKSASFYIPLYMVTMSVVAIAVSRNGGGLVKQARTLLESALFRSQAILIDIIGNLSRADVRVGKSQVDSIESSSVVARSDFTARFWSAQLTSEAARLDSPRELLALETTGESSEWLGFFRSEIEKLREEGVKPVVVDLSAAEVEQLVRANIEVSAARSGARQRAKQQAQLEAPGPPQPTLLGSQDPAPQLPGVAGYDSSEFKECPDCAEMVRIRARKCRFCGYMFAD